MTSIRGIKDKPSEEGQGQLSNIHVYGSVLITSAAKVFHQSIESTDVYEDSHGNMLIRLLLYVYH
jgi:hypothetical protein